MPTEEALHAFAERVSRARVPGLSSIAVSLSGKDGGTFTLRVSEKDVAVVRDIGDETAQISIAGDVAVISEVFEGRRNIFGELLAGKVYVRGSISHISKLARDLNWLP